MTMFLFFISARELVVKWKSIRDHFIKELKIYQNENLNKSLKKKKKYIYYDQLTFLLPTVDSRHFKTASETDNESILLRELIRDEFDPEALSMESAVSNASMDNDGEPARKKQRGDIYNYSSLTQDSYGSHVITSATDVLEVEQNVDVNVHQPNYLPIEQIDTGSRDRLGNKAFFVSLLPLVNKIPEDSVINFRVEMMHLVQKYLQQSKFVCEKTENNFEIFGGD